MKFFLDALNKYADFTGKTNRQQYWIFILFYIIIYIGLLVVDNVLGTYLLSLIFALGMLVPSISIATRRLHDTNRSGWWQLIALVPLVGIVVLMVFLAQESKE
ncbi:MAG: hypothetical protein COW84_10125 [Gammaproteobacteria bacterium CG22_combo_CG10-13_8_21_14_all_40_8]|nr:MAG: hypothetical protein COW84_10125 [Gammaproteobacteria bacterium CG22_combo_CG10-13_8_21_14_all_40_8]